MRSCIVKARGNPVFYGQDFPLLLELRIPDLQKCRKPDPKRFPLLNAYIPSNLDDRAYEHCLTDPSMFSLLSNNVDDDVKLPVTPISAASLTYKDPNELGAKLHRVWMLTYYFRTQADLESLYSELNAKPRTADGSSAPAQLRGLRLIGDDARVAITLGAGHLVQHLALQKTSTTLHGENFRMLTSLRLHDGTFTLKGNFQSLQTLTLHNATLVSGDDFTAPALQQLEFVGARGVGKFSIGKRRFPALQQVIIMYSFLDDKIVVFDPSRLPKLVPDEELNLGPRVVLHIDQRIGQNIPKFSAFLPQWVVFPMRPFTYACGLRKSWTIW